jgi:hypothetical protein
LRRLSLGAKTSISRCVASHRRPRLRAPGGLSGRYLGTAHRPNRGEPIYHRAKAHTSCLLSGFPKQPQRRPTTPFLPFSGETLLHLHLRAGEKKKIPEAFLLLLALPRRATCPPPRHQSTAIAVHLSLFRWWTGRWRCSLSLLGFPCAGARTPTGGPSWGPSWAMAPPTEWQIL